MQKNDKIGKLFGAVILIIGAVYLTYRAPFWIDSKWKISFCYLAALLLVLAGIILVVEQIGSKREGK